MRTLRWLPVLLLFASPAALTAQEATGGAKIYKDAVASTVWVHSTRLLGLATGSGTLIDAGRRLVLTNYHVVEENPRVTIFFPEYRDGRPIPERTHYTDRAKRLGVRGKVIALDKGADLAVIQIDAVPEGVKAIAVAARSPEPGELVHSIGNAGKSGALWGYVNGTVRQVYRKKWQAALSKTKTAQFEARVIETDTPTNPGDSGGPLLNDKGELVGVTQGGALNASLVSFFVDASEVKQLLAARDVKDVKGKDEVKPVVKRTEPIAPSDAAKVFDAAKLKALEPKLAELFKANAELVIETHAAAPAEWLDKAKKATPAGRVELYREWGTERLKAAKSDGALILVTLDPRVIHVEFPEAMRKRYPDKFAQKVGDALIKAFKDKKPDDGLAEAVKLLQDNLVKGKS
jgi:hypothetical protein